MIEEKPAAGTLRGQHLFITGLGIGQICSWGSLYYSFPLIAEAMGRELGYSKPELYGAGAVAELVGIEGGVVSEVINLESSGVEASDWRLRHDQAYHEA